MSEAASIPRDAATVIVARDGTDGLEVFLLRRSASSAFAPDQYVFPGGGVDAGDDMVAGGPDTEHTLRIAAIRESFEEAGILFVRPAPDAATVSAARARALAERAAFGDVLAWLGVAPDVTALVPFSRWITPAGQTRRFDARFYVARLPTRQEAIADAHETHDGVWLSPKSALERYRRGELAMIFPTVKHLERIAPYMLLDDLEAFARSKSITPVMPSTHDGALGIAPELEDQW